MTFKRWFKEFSNIIIFVVFLLAVILIPVGLLALIAHFLGPIAAILILVIGMAAIFPFLSE